MKICQIEIAKFIDTIKTVFFVRDYLRKNELLFQYRQKYLLVKLFLILFQLEIVTLNAPSCLLYLTGKPFF